MGGGKADLQKVLETCTKELQRLPRYNNDIRFLRIWIQYVSALLGDDAFGCAHRTADEGAARRSFPFCNVADSPPDMPTCRRTASPTLVTSFFTFGCVPHRVLFMPQCLPDITSSCTCWPPPSCA